MTGLIKQKTSSSSVQGDREDCSRLGASASEVLGVFILVMLEVAVFSKAKRFVLSITEKKGRRGA